MLGLAALAWSVESYAAENGVSADGYAVITEGVPHDRLFSVGFRGRRGVAVGEVGQVMVTSDHGRTWTREKAPTELALLGVTVGEGITVAVGQMGLILRRRRGGDDASDWQVKDVAYGEGIGKQSRNNRLFQVDINDKGLGIVVGAFGTVLRTTDAGKTWRYDPPDWDEIFEADSGGGGVSGAAGEPQMYAVHVGDDGTILIGGELQYIVRSPDGGDTWEVVHRGQNKQGEIDPSIFDMDIQPDGVGYAVGQSGAVFKTTDYGRVWKRMETPVDANLLAVESTGKSHVKIVGMRTSLSSDDGGESWNILRELDLNTTWYSDVETPADHASLVAVGHSGRIITLPGVVRRKQVSSLTRQSGYER